VIYLKRNISIILFITISLLITGCGNGNNNATEFSKKDKAPSSLKDVSSGIDDILNSIGSIERLTLDIPLTKEEEERKQREAEAEGQQGGESGSQSQGGQETESGGGEGEGEEGQSEGGQEEQSGSNQSSGSNQPQGNKQQQEEQKKQEDIKKEWENVEKKLEDIHQHWNSFEVEGQKKGATKEQGDKFESALNKLTTSVEKENVFDIYDYSRQAYANLKPLYDLYVDDIGGDVSMLKSMTYETYLRAVQGDKQGALSSSENKDEYINKIRLKLTKDEEKDALEKISLSLSDFREGLTENSRRLFMIKKDTIIRNIKEIEE